MTTRWKLPSTMLPSGAREEWWVYDGRLTARPVKAAKALPGRFVCPGLVDSHTHLAIHDFAPAGLAQARQALFALRDAGVLLVRDLGAPKGVDLEFGGDEPRPTVIAAGPWLATEEFFTDDRHDPVAPADLATKAVDVVRSGCPWVKVVADWMEPNLTYPFDVLKAMVDAVHHAGGRVAAHANWQVARVVAAGVDSLEHGADIDDATLAVMAERGVAWVPTLASIEDGIRWASGVIAAFDPATSSRKHLEYASHWKRVWENAVLNLSERIPFAVSRGVTILAGADNSGTLAREVELLAQYGLSGEDALAAASTLPRQFLRVPSIAEGAAADVVTYDTDPREDLAALARPRAVLLGGTRVH